MCKAFCPDSKSSVVRPVTITAICNKPAYSSNRFDDQEWEQLDIETFDSVEDVTDYLEFYFNQNIFGRNKSDWDITILIDGRRLDRLAELEPQLQQFYEPVVSELNESLQAMQSKLKAQRQVELDEAEKHRKRDVAAQERATTRAEKEMLRKLTKKYGTP